MNTCTSKQLFCENKPSSLTYTDEAGQKFCSLKCLIDFWSEIFQEQMHHDEQCACIYAEDNNHICYYTIN